MKKLMGALALGIALTCTSAFALDRPNILVILVDDLGYDAPSIAPGGPPISTPSIDALARRGVRARNGYAVAAVCAPARAGLMTGLDLVPTALSAAQAPAASGLDGQNLLPSLRSASVPIPTRPLVWRLNTTCAPLRPELLAARQGRWKLVVNDGVEQVFDLLTDEGETQPVNYPPALNSLRNIAANWQAQMLDPLWCES